MLDFVRSGADAMDESRRTCVVRFGTYELGLQSGELRKSGMRIRLQQQPLRLLEILLERPGELVAREELRSRMWPNESFGDFDQAVNVAIAKLRAALGDSADNPRYVETLPRRGYRFIAQVTFTDLAGKSGADPKAGPGSEQQTGRDEAANATPSNVTSSRSWLIAGAAVMAMLLLLAAIGLWRHFGNAAQPVEMGSSPVRSLAVLPLENLSTSSEDYFADGMTDELITDLAQISALRVISRTSIMPYKGVRKPLPQIARELSVDAVVEGTVLRSGRQVRITAQLIRAPADKHLWAQSYEGDMRDTLALQKKVARAIAEQIRITLTPRERTELDSVKAVSPEAYENYLKGRYFWNKRTDDGMKKAIVYFTEAIENDPSYSLPHAGLADIYQVSDRPQLARSELQKALALDEQSAEAHSSLARLLYLFDHDWLGADKEFKRALEIDHNYAPAHHWYSMFLALEGHKEQALSEAERAYELDPLSGVVGANLAKILQENGQDDRAIEQAKKTLDLEPDSAVTHAVLGITYEHKGLYPDAIAEYKKALQSGGPAGEIRGLLGYAYAVSGDRTSAQQMVTELKTLLPRHPHAALDLAVAFAGLGDRENVLYWLEKAQELHVSDLIGIEQDPHFVQVRGDRRFQSLAKSVSLPQ